MIRTHTIQTAFVGGELSPLLLGRADTDRFKLGGETVENFLVRHQGPLVRRRGTQLTHETDCAFARLVSFQLSNTEASMIQWGCGQIIADVVATPTYTLPATVVFSQYDGPFTYPSHLFNEGGFYFKAVQVAGENKGKNCASPHSPGLYDCEIGDGVTSFINGVCHTHFYGSYQMTLGSAVPLDSFGDPAGAEPLACMVTRWGMLAPYAFFPSDGFGSELEVRALTFSGLLSEISDTARGYTLFEKTVQYPQLDVFANAVHSVYVYRFKTLTEAGLGSFSGSVLSYIWCPGYEVVLTYSQMVWGWDINTTVARTGEPARTQHLVAYDAGARTYTGSQSKAVFTVTPTVGTTALVGEFLFMVTPTVGTPYTIPMVLDFTASFPTTEVTLGYPWVTGAEVYLSSWSFSNQLSVSEEFSALTNDEEYFEIDPSTAWGYQGYLMCPCPNSGCLDGFDDADLDFPVVSSLVTGKYWAADGVIISIDPIDAYDDFEMYPAGTVYVIGYGLGWTAQGYVQEQNYANVDDDFESYVAGTITTLTAGTSLFASWVDDGSITLYDYSNVDDDFESYAVGTITTLPGGSNYVATWVASGTIL